MSCKRQSSAAAASDSLCDVVKFAIAESEKEQKAAERDRVCVTILGVCECSRDLPRELCEYLDCNVYMINVVQIGIPAKSSKKPRLYYGFVADCR